MNRSTPGLPVHHQLLELAQTHVHRVGDAIQPSHPLLSLSPPAFNLSQHQGLFQGVSFSQQVAKALDFQLHQSFQWIFWTDSLYNWLAAVQGTHRSLFQHYSSKASMLRHWAFFVVQLSHPYMTTGKTITVTTWTFVGKVMSLFFSMFARLVTAFLPRSKRLLISWLQSPSAVTLEPTKIVCHCFHCFPTYLPWSDGTRRHDLSFWMLSFKPAFSFSSFTLIKRLLNSPSLSAIRVVSSAYLRLLIVLPVILIPACASSSLAFHMMYSAYKLNKQGDNIQPVLLFIFGASLFFHVQF